jgi:HSP20 family protein
MHGDSRFLREFEEFRIRARHLFEERHQAAGIDGRESVGEWTPAVDVYETADRLVLAAEIAGVRREDITIELLGNVLTLRGSRSAERVGVGAEGYLRMEVPSGRFERSFALPGAVAPEGVEAVLRDGVLTVTVTRGKESHGRRIAVETA